MKYLLILPLLILCFGCEQDNEFRLNTPAPIPASTPTTVEQTDVPTYYRGDIYQLAKGCYTIHSDDQSSVITQRSSQSGSGYHFATVDSRRAASFLFQPTALGQYILYDNNQHYLATDNNQLTSITTLLSEMVLPIAENQSLVSPAEWQLHSVGDDSDNELFQLYNRKQQKWLTSDGLSANQDNAQSVKFFVAEVCATFPEANIATTGKITKTRHEDGTLWGYVDAHEHIMANYGTGGRMMHGAAFHKFGIAHALADCEKHHGPNGQYDLINLATATPAATTASSRPYFSLVDALTEQQKIIPEFNHITKGYPTMDDWDVHTTMTHQQLYYKWIERAYLGGMRLIVEYFESVEVVCEVYQRLIPVSADQSSCNEMDHVDYQLSKMQDMQDYIDAQHGGPGKGWFRLVYSPNEARDVIADGKLAVIMGLEIENPFNCFTYDKPNHPQCTESDIRQRLKKYYDKGIRAIFPAHKFNNGFAAGDGSSMGGILELGDFLNSARYRSYDDCKAVPGLFYGSHGEGNELSIANQIFQLGPILRDLIRRTMDKLNLPLLPIYPIADSHCQSNGFTQAGRTLMTEMMKLGMIIDTAHMPRAALSNAIPWLINNRYPAVNTHNGNTHMGRLIGGFTSGELRGTCRNDDGQSPIVYSFQKLVNEIDFSTGLSRQGVSYDFNGLAGYNKPRFGPKSPCQTEQVDTLQYPFKSPAGDITFDKLVTGTRTYDFNYTGLANIGLMPDLIEEARRAGASEEGMELYFKSAEAYIQTWEKMEARSNEITILEDNITEIMESPIPYDRFIAFFAYILKWLSPILTPILF